MKERLSLYLGTAFGIGFIPGAPGTYASFATAVAFYLVFRAGHRILPELHLSVLGLITVVGTLASEVVSRSRGIEDPSIVVIDEVAGQLLAFLFLPVTFGNLILGTFLFRVFDIWKPFPVRQMESLKRGVGIMADDLMAGLYANLILQATHRWMPF
jgi:phosphatidylglycerophosphatase A